MQREINGDLYDTDTAERVVTHRITQFGTELPGLRETLYKTRDDEYFVHEERWELGERRAIDYEPAEPDVESLDVVSDAKALQWCKMWEIDDDIVVNEFGCTVKSLEEKRKAVVEQVEGLIRDVEEYVDQDLAFIRKNTNIARRDWADDGEYDHCVRMALIQLHHQIPKSDDGADDVANELGERVDQLSENLEQEAELPPPEDLTR